MRKGYNVTSSWHQRTHNANILHDVYEPVWYMAFANENMKIREEREKKIIKNILTFMLSRAAPK